MFEKWLAKNSIKLIQLSLILLLLYFCFWWLFKLDTLPGLHGDEAWAGLKANEFNKTGVDHLYGMNTYTGILQPILSGAIFKMFDIGIFQLRAGSVFFNLLALVIISSLFHKNGFKKTLLIFLLIISQSALYLISPRVAWEVNTFTLFFISLLIASTFKLFQYLDNPKSISVLLFLVTNILGSYNHVLFSCVSIAMLLGILLWSFNARSFIYKNVIILLIINLCNLVGVFIAMRYWSDVISFKNLFFILAALVILLISELIFLKFSRKIPISKVFNVNQWIIRLILFVACINFTAYHGMAFFQVISNFKLLVHAYSYQPGICIEILFSIGGIIFTTYFFYFLWMDISIFSTSSLFAFIIIAYCGLLPFYTTNCSFRYYLSIYAIVGVYMAFSSSKIGLRATPLFTSLIMMFVLLNMALFDVFFLSRRQIKALDLSIGNGQIETSAHFLPNKPLIDFLKKNQIGGITYLSNQYFLEQPVLFYKLIKPWKELPVNKAIIDYDFNGYKGGYMLYKLN